MGGRYAVKEDRDPVCEPCAEDVESSIFDIRGLDTCYEFRNEGSGHN
jgi:hypothetical protein